MNTIWLIANGTFGEAIRRRTLLIFLLVAAAVIVAGAASASLRGQHDTTVIKILGLGVILLTGVFISVILGINLLPTEIERRTVYTVLSKPVHRYQFVCGKFLGGLMTVLTSVAVMSAVFILLLVVKERSFNGPVIDACKGLLLIAFAILLVNAVAMFFSVFLSPFVNFFLTFSVYLLGSASSVTQALADPGNDPAHPKNPLVVLVFKVIHAVIPNFAAYNVKNPLLDPSLQITNEPQFIASNIAIAIVYTLILLTLAALIFERREV